MEGDELTDREKVLEKYSVQFDDKYEELECIITESHLVIEAEKAIRIPFSHIYDCDIYHPMSSNIGYSISQPSKPLSGTATLKYLDETNNENKFTLQIAAGNLFLFRQTIYRQMDKYENPERDKYREKLEDTPTNSLFALGFPYSIPFIPVIFVIEKAKKYPAFAIAFSATFIPISILLLIIVAQVEGMGLTTLGTMAASVLVTWIIALIPIFIVFLFLRRWLIALGIVLSSVIGLPIAFVLLIVF